MGNDYGPFADAYRSGPFIDRFGVDPSRRTDGNQLDQWSTGGAITAIAGALTGAIGSFFAVKAEQTQLKSARLSREFEASMSAINARNAEREAQSILESNREDVGALTMQAGAEKGARRATMAARGIRLGVGSAAEVQASGDLLKEMDVLTMERNAVRASAAARMGAVNARNQGLLAGVSARNLGRSAASMSPTSALSTSLLTSASRVGGQWATDRRYGGGGV